MFSIETNKTCFNFDEMEQNTGIYNTSCFQGITIVFMTVKLIYDGFNNT